MTDIATTLAQARAKLAAWQAEAATAAASGAAQAQSADAAWDAVAAIEADKARTEGATPPIADATATALRGVLVSATGLTATKLDAADLRTAVSGVDSAIASLDDAAITTLATALVNLESTLQDCEDAQASADAAITAAEASPAIVADDLAKALLAREAAQRQAAAGNKAAAVLAYVDYQAARARLATAATAAPATKLQTDWNTARDAQLSAVADLLAAQLAVIQAQLELSRKRASMTAKLATRDADATAAVDAVLNPPAPPGP
ncbi:hypothetical protein [Zoogloea sp.]|uniref:hypothetical protein n=1 Tax=Zoogloea sp. TaxID=49181 RepID=UPI0035B41473